MNYDEDQIRQDMIAEEDGRGGKNFETRNVAPVHRSTAGQPECRWCGHSMTGDGVYHAVCLAQKRQLEGRNAQKDGDER
jgi:hypothetical protein